MLTVKINRVALARYGISVADVQALVEVAVGGKSASLVFEGDRRFDLVVRLPEQLRTDIDAIRNLPIPLAAAEGQAGPLRASLDNNGPTSPQVRYLPLSAVVQLDIAPGPNEITREDGKRRIVVSANVRERDLGTFVADAQQAIADKVKLPTGYYVTWGGQFENLASASQRLAIVVPIALLLIFVLLFTSLGSAADSALVFSGVPLALTGALRRCRCAASRYRSAPASASSRCPASPCSTGSLSSPQFSNCGRKDAMSSTPCGRAR